MYITEINEDLIKNFRLTINQKKVSSQNNRKLNPKIFCN